MALPFWGWALKGLRGAINLIRQLVRDRAALNTTFATELKECAAELTDLASQADSLNQDRDQGAEGLAAPPPEPNPDDFESAQRNP